MNFIFDFHTTPAWMGSDYLITVGWLGGIPRLFAIISKQYLLKVFGFKVKDRRSVKTLLGDTDKLEIHLESEQSKLTAWV